MSGDLVWRSEATNKDRTRNDAIIRYRVPDTLAALPRPETGGAGPSQARTKELPGVVILEYKVSQQHLPTYILHAFARFFTEVDLLGDYPSTIGS